MSRESWSGDGVVPDAAGRIGTWWKAAAGCAICASLIAGIIEDARHWVWDQTVGLVFPEQASFDTCLSRQVDSLRRPEGALYQVIVTVPLGDRDQVAFRTIETSLTRAYGETQAAAIRVGALDCEPLKPTSGDTATRLETARLRADALLERTGADVVLWGEVFADGRTMELRFAHPQDTSAAASDPAQGSLPADRAALYEAGAITLDLNFGQDVGALVAARALDRSTAISGGFRLDQGAVAAQIGELLGPLVAARPPGMTDANYAMVLLSEGLAAGTAAMASGNGPALLAVSDRLMSATEMFPSGEDALRDFAGIASLFYRANAAQFLPAAEAREALELVVVELRRAGKHIERTLGHDAAITLNSDLGLAMALTAALIPEPDRSKWLRDGIARLREAAVALPQPLMLLQFATGINARIALSDAPTAVALNVEAMAANERALAALPADDRSTIWLRAMTLRGALLMNRATGGFDPDPRATVDDAIAALTAAVETSGDTAARVDFARAQATLGWVLVARALQSEEGDEVAAYVDRAEDAMQAALTVYGPTSSPNMWGWSLEGLAHGFAACALRPDCPGHEARRAAAAAQFGNAAEAYAVAGQTEQAEHARGLSEKYKATP